MGLALYNSLSRTKEEFKPLEEGQVGIYVCGPTVYGPPHLGHAKSYITFDVLVKYLRNRGLKVRYIQNITDVGHLTDNADAGEDKIQKQARLDQVHPLELVDRYMMMYQHDMESLRVAHPNIYVRATQHIGEQIEMIQGLLEKGNAYEANGNIYFDVQSFPNYGKLSGRVLEEQLDAVRVDARTDKRNPRDFALWKRAEPGHILKWNSPWGPGYPGWHIECSAMSIKYIGDTLDIHGGGIENRFPHHECEIAQSESYTGKQFVRYWVHNNMVTVDGVKMSKSLGNFKTCQDLLSSHKPEAIRAFILSTHYRSPTNYTEEAITASATGLSRLAQLSLALRNLENVNNSNASAANETTGEAPDDEIKKCCETIEKAIIDSLDNDLDTPGAIAHLYNFTTEVNRILTAKVISPSSAKHAQKILSLWGSDILGIIPAAEESMQAADVSPLMDIIVEFRNDMKATKQFDKSDKIRTRLKDAGYVIEDTRDGSRWKRL